MQIPTRLLFLLFFFNLQSSIHAENSTQQGDTAGKIRTDVSTMEEALEALNELTLAQKRVQEQQQAHRGEMQTRFTQLSETEQARAKALQTEQDLLKEIRGKISRKLKVLAKNENKKKTSGSNNCNGYSTTDIPPKDCSAIYLNGEDTSGVYKVWPTWSPNGKSFPVHCDMDTDGGGWTVIHRWSNSDTSESFFDRTYAEHKEGFGDLTKSHWLGAEKMHQLTNQGSYELRFDFEEGETNRSSAVYRRFRIDNSNNQYKVHVEGFDASGAAEDVFSFSNGVFLESGRCPHTSSGRKVWWFTTPGCQITSKLNVNSSTLSGGSTLMEMKIRPVQFIRLRESK